VFLSYLHPVGTDCYNPIIFPHAEFADVLEQLEATFYSQALVKFKESDFTAAGFPSAQLAIEQFLSIRDDEVIHATVLEVRLGSIAFVPISTMVVYFFAGDYQGAWGHTC
jgi:hypothetical protein